MRIFIRLSVVFVVFTLIALIPMFIDWNSYTSEFEKNFKDETGFDLKVDGGITFKMFPKPNLYLKNVRIGELNKKKEEQVELVNASGVFLRVKYIPLFFKSIIPTDIFLYNPKFYTRHIEDAKFDINEFLFKNLVKKEDMPSFDFSNPEKDIVVKNKGFSFNKLNIIDGVIKVDSEQLKTLYVFDKLDGSIDISSASGPFSVDFEFNYKSAPYSVKLTTSELSKSSPTIVDFSISRNDKDKFSLKGKGTLKDSVFEGVLQGDAISLYGMANSFVKVDKLYEKFNIPAIFGIDKIVINDGIKVLEGTVNLGKQDDNNSVTQGAFSFEIDENQNIKSNMEFAQISIAPFMDLINKFSKDIKENNISFEKGKNVQFSLMSDVVNYKNSAAKKLSIKFDINEGLLNINDLSIFLPGNGNLKVEGKIKDDEFLDIDGKINVSFDNLSDFTKWAGYDVGKDSLTTYKKVDLSGVLKGNVNSINLTEMLLRFDDISFKGALGFEKNDESPYVKIVLSSDVIAIDGYLSGDIEEYPSYKEFLSTCINKIKMLIPYDYDLKVDAKSFVYKNYNFEDFKLNMSKINNLIDVKDISSSNVSGLAFAINGKIDGVENSFKSLKTEIKTDDVLSSNLVKLIKFLKIKLPNFNKFKTMDISFEINGKVDDLSLSSMLKSDVLNVGINGNFADNYNYEVDITHPNFKNFLSLFQDKYYPDNAGVWFKLRTNVNNEGEKIFLKNIQSSIGSMKISGSGLIENLIDKRKKISLSFDAPDFIMDTFLYDKDMLFWKNKAGKRKPNWSKENIDLSFLSNFDASLILSSEKFELSPYTVKNVYLKADLSDKNLNISIDSKDFYNGVLTLKSSLNFAGESALKLSIDVADAKISEPLFKSKELDLILGEGNFKGDFTMLGKTVYDMVTNINGSGNFEIKSGVLSNFSLGALEKYHKLISVDNSYLDKNEISEKISEEVNKGVVDFVNLKGNFVTNAGLFRAFETNIVVPNFDTKVDSILFNIKDWNMDVNISFALSKMEYPPLKIEIKDDIDKVNKKVDVKDFIEKIVKLSNENREFAEAKSRKNLADITKFLSDNDNLYVKAREYISDLKDMFGKDNTLSVIYDNALDKYKEMTNLVNEKDELKKIRDSGNVSGDDVVNSLNLYNSVEKIFKVIEQSRANTMAEAFKATISKYSKDAMSSSNALLSISTKNPNNKKIKDIFEKANQNAINAESLSHKALGLLDSDELKKIQKEVVDLAVGNIKLEASARDVLRNKVVKEGAEVKVEEKVKEEPKLIAPKLDLKLKDGITIPVQPSEKQEKNDIKVKGVIKRY